MNLVAAGYQHWRQLLFLHWPVPAPELRPLVPSSLTIDEFEGSAFVGLVPFVVTGARPVGAPLALGLQFVETNVRTYVHLDGREPGVYFFSLDAGSVLAVIGARASLGLPYFWASGQQRTDSTTLNYCLRRRVGRRPGCHVRYQVGVYQGPARQGSLEDFLIERYVLHVQRGGTLWSVRVRHQPYPLHRAQLNVLEDQLVPAAGVNIGSQPPLVHFASGVDVAISPPRIRRLRTLSAC